MTEKKIYTPNLKWYQDKNYVYLDIEAYNSTDFNLKISDNNLLFSYISNNNYYEMKFELFDKADHIKYMDYTSSIKITLEKRNKEYWRYLTYDKNLYKNYIKLNWNNWTGDDSDNEKDDNKNIDFASMMQNMGGMMNNENSPFDFSKMMESMNTQSLGSELDNLDDNEDDDNLEEVDNESDDFCESCANND